MIERTTPIGTPETVPCGWARIPGHGATQTIPLEKIMAFRKMAVEVDRDSRYSARQADFIDVPSVDRKVMPPSLGGPARPVTEPGWLPQPIDDAVALLVGAGYTPQPQVVRGRQCYHHAGIDMMLMPFGKGTLTGPREWVMAASEQLDEGHYERWGETP